MVNVLTMAADAGTEFVLLDEQEKRPTVPAAHKRPTHHVPIKAVLAFVFGISCSVAALFGIPGALRLDPAASAPEVARAYGFMREFYEGSGPLSKVYGGEADGDSDGVAASTALNRIATEQAADQPLLQDGTTFNQVLLQNEYVFVNFFAHWCQHSQNLQPVWKSLGGRPSLSNITFLELNCEIYAELCREHRIMGFPTLRFFKHAKPQRQAPDYLGPPDGGSITAFLERRMQGIIDDGSDYVAALGRAEASAPKKIGFRMADKRSLPLSAANAKDYVPREGKYLDKLLPLYPYIFVNFLDKEPNPEWNKLIEGGGFRDVLILSVNCQEEYAICDKHRMIQRPIINAGFFQNGDMVNFPDFHWTSTVVTYREFLMKQVAADYNHTVLAEFSATMRQGAADNDTNNDETNEKYPSWDLDVEFAVRARDLNKLFSDTVEENVVVLFTSSSSECESCIEFRPMWHEFAHRGRSFQNFLVAEIDCSKTNCPSNGMELPFYRWYHKGEEVGSAVTFHNEQTTTTTVDTLLTHTVMMLDMEKIHTPK